MLQLPHLSVDATQSQSPRRRGGSYPGRVVVVLRGPVVIQLILLYVPIGLHYRVRAVVKVQQVVCGNIYIRGEGRTTR